MQTLSNINELNNTGFGRPKPRHGLKLLYWFATGCVNIDRNDVMQSLCNPKNGQFGFHVFQNRRDEGSKLLPEVINTLQSYYEVGNLNGENANNLPSFVREDYHHSGEANRDRVIVSVNNNDCFEKVYVTTHSDQSQFNINATYEIDKQLLKSIQGMKLDAFLTESGYQTQNNAKVANSGTTASADNPRSQPSVPQATSGYTSPARPSENRHTQIDMEPDLILDNSKSPNPCGCTIL